MIDVTWRKGGHLLSKKEPHEGSPTLIKKPPFRMNESFGLKIVSAFIAAIVFMFSSFTVYTIFHEGEKAKQHLREHGDLFTNLLATNSAVGVFAENTTLLKESAGGILGCTDVVSVSVYNSGMKILYAGDKKNRLHTSEPLIPDEILKDVNRNPGSTNIRESDEFFEFVSPVLADPLLLGEETPHSGNYSVPVSKRKIIGYVRIVLSKESYRKEISSILVRNGIIMLIFIACSSIIVLAAIKKVMRPLTNLTESVMALGSGLPVKPLQIESRDEIGNLASAFSSMITARGQAEQSLRDSEKKFRMLAETTAAAIFIYRGDSFYYFNSAAEKLTGYSRDELMAINFWTIVHPDFKPLMKDLAAGDMHDSDEPFHCDFKIITKNGDERWVDFTFRIIEFEGKPTALGTAYDLTPHKKLEAQFVQARKMEAVGVLAGEMAHDFKNFISAVISYTHMAKTRCDDSDPHRYLDLILTCSERAANFTHGLLTFSRKQTLSPRPVSVNEVLASVNMLIPPLIGEKIELKTTYAEKDMVIVADSGQLEQILINIADNARHAMPDGGSLSISAEPIELDDEFIRTNGYGSRGSYALITITDNGIGMDKKTQERIFEPFFTTKEAGKGTGLGLSIVYGIVKQHSGYIVVSSNPGAGASFRIYFPLIHPSLKPLELHTGTSHYRGTETILLAEDDDLVRDVIIAHLSDAGYKVIATADGDQALAKFTKHKDEIELVILDLMMPLKNGQEVWTEIQRIKPHLIVLFLTGCTDKFLKEANISVDSLNVLMKPISSDALLKKIRTSLNESAPRKSRMGRPSD